MRAHLLLIKPNTDAAVTQAMRDIAAEDTPAGVEIRACTAPFGAALITDEAALARAGEAVQAALADMSMQGCAGAIVSAFGDPGPARPGTSTDGLSAPERSHMTSWS